MNTIDHYLPLILVAIIAFLLIKIGWMKLQRDEIKDRWEKVLFASSRRNVTLRADLDKARGEIKELKMRAESIELDIANNKVKFLEKKVTDQQHTIKTFGVIIRSLIGIRVENIFNNRFPKRK